MSVIKNPFFLFPCMVFWINQFLERVLNIFIPYVHSYLDDLMAMPVILGITLQIYRWIHPLKNSFAFTKVQVFVGVVYVSLIFEVLLPLWYETYIMDIWDIPCYVIGAFYFYLLINRK
jgi:hypothetical protein